MGGNSSKEGSKSPLTNTTFHDKLLQPPDDDSVRQTWTILRGAIDAHARRFYHSDRVYQTKEAIREAVRQHGVVDAAQEAEDLAALLFSPRHRKLGLRICIARVLLASIDFRGDPEETSLDPAVVELMSKFEKLRPELGSEEEAALSAWRMITAFFLQPAAQDLRKSKHACVETLNRLLVIFANDPSEREARSASLAMLAARTIELGEKLFCHGSRWIFEWRKPSSKKDKRREIVLFPTLMRADDEGRKVRGGVKYAVIKRKATSSGAFFDTSRSGAEVTSTTSDEESGAEEPPRGRKRKGKTTKKK